MRTKALLTCGAGVAFTALLATALVGITVPALAADGQVNPSPSSSPNGQPTSTTDDVFTYSFDIATHTATVTGDNKTTPHVVIPAVVYDAEGGRYSVTAIAENAFTLNATIRTVTIADSVKSIGTDAFANDRNLESVVIGSSVTSIGSDAFSNSGLVCAAFLGAAPRAVTAANGTVGVDGLPVSKNESFPSSNQGFTVHYVAGTSDFVHYVAGTSDVSPVWQGYKAKPGATPPAEGDFSLLACTGYLGTAANYSTLAAAAITAPASKFHFGNVGAGAAFTNDGNTEFLEGAALDAANVSGASNDLLATYNTLRVLPGKAMPGDLGGITFTPGVYHSDAALTDSGHIIFDGGGDNNAVFVIESSAAINTTAATTMDLINGAKASNIYWVSDAATTLGAGSTFDGNILSLSAITVGAGSTINGRLLSVTAAVTLDADVISSNPLAGQPKAGTNG